MDKKYILIPLTLLANVTQGLMLAFLTDLLNTSSYEVTNITIPHDGDGDGFDEDGNRTGVEEHKYSCYIKFKDIYDKQIEKIQNDTIIKNKLSVREIYPYLFVKIVLCIVNAAIILNREKLLQSFKAHKLLIKGSVNTYIVIFIVILLILSAMSFIYFGELLRLKNIIKNDEKIKGEYDKFKNRFNIIIGFGMTSSILMIFIVIVDILVLLDILK
jgi:hypothetical protein